MGSQYQTPQSRNNDPANIDAVMLHIWMQEPSRNVHDRLVQSIYTELEPYHSYSLQSHCGYTQSIRSNSSMAPVSLHQQDSLYPPSLVYSKPDSNVEATPTESSVSTGLASYFTGVPLLEDNNGVLERRGVVRRTPQYQCVFWFLNCDELFRDRDTWEMHCLSHFRCEEPPKSVLCPLCSWTMTHEDSLSAWSCRMAHLADSHLLIGETLRTSRPDFHLFQHLWQKRLISDQDLKELKGGNHNLTRRPANFVTANGRDARRERDGRNQRFQHLARR